MKAREYVRGKLNTFAFTWIFGTAVGGSLMASSIGRSDSEIPMIIGCVMCIIMAIYPIRFIVVTFSELIDGEHKKLPSEPKQPDKKPMADRIDPRRDLKDAEPVSLRDLLKRQ